MTKQKILSSFKLYFSKAHFILDNTTCDTISVQEALIQSATFIITLSISVVTVGSNIQHPFLQAIGMKLQFVLSFQLTCREQLLSHQLVRHQILNVSQYIQT